MRNRKSMVALLLALTLVATACGSQKQDAAAEDVVVSAEQALTESTQDAEDTAEQEAKSNEPGVPDTSVYMDASQDVEVRIEALLSQMTLEEKAAQMVQPEQNGLDPEDVKKYGIGSVLSGGGSAPASGNTMEDWENRINELKQAAVESRLGIPLLYGVDAVHGNNNIYGTTVFPHNIALGAANDEQLMTQIGEVVAEEVRAAGVQWTFAPTLGNAQNERWGRTYECFNEDAGEVAKLGAAYIRGLQGEKGTENYLDENHVLACAKHYIGEGYTEDGVNQGNVDMTAEEFDALMDSGLLDPYTAALDEGVLTVMISYNSVDGVKCHENKHLIQEVLKDELGFRGLVVSDYNAIQQTNGKNYKDQVRLSLDAGVDLFMEPYNWQDCMQAIIALAENGDISMERVDDAVSRILRVKFEAGMFEEEIGGAHEKELVEQAGCEEHRDLARQAVRESLVLLKNDTVNGTSALDALNQAKNIQVSGQKAYDMGAQCGGWTISWQGQNGKITKGTTIIEGIAEVTAGRDLKLTHDVTGVVNEEADALMVVVGEEPYAETDGDRTAGTLVPSAKDQEVLKAVRESLEQRKDRIPVVAVIVAGRPLDLTEYQDLFDGIVMAWLPGTEGAGVADVLFGDYEFQGTLPVTWLKDMEDLPAIMEADLNGTQVDPQLVLYERGTGLRKQ